MHMTSKILAACVTVALALPVVTLADQPAATPVVATPGKGISTSETVEARATVIAIDAATRTVTVKGDQGVWDVEAGPDVKNFDKIEVGDVIALTYTMSVAAHIAAPGEAAPGVKDVVQTLPAGEGERKVGREVTASLKVDAVDAAANKVTLSNASGRTRTVDVVNPQVQERLKTLKPGDVVVVTYTESLAIKLEKVAAE
jgi:hypothetical protein